MENDLHGTQWDCCVVGNGVAALWMSHWLWSSKKTVLWITSEEPYSPQRAMLQHGWLWGLSAENAQLLTNQIQGFEAGTALPDFELAYYDARSSKRFRQVAEVRQDWGTHEREFFQSLFAIVKDLNLSEAARPVDLWNWHARLHGFHDSGQVKGPTRVELFSEPRFVRVQGWPLVELKTTEHQITGAVLADLKPSGTGTEIVAKRFYLADFEESLPGLIKDEADSQTLGNVLKGKAYRAGFGLRLWHQELASAPSQTLVIPMVVSPNEKGAGSHVVGRFVKTERGLESFWTGLLNDEELEDNNEILKKIKQAKRALDRAIPGFVDSIQREAVTFEPRMYALDLVKNRKSEALGAQLLSDHYGAEVAALAVKKIFSGDGGDIAKVGKKKVQKTRPDPELGV